jgi:hypothetical protein
MGKAPKKEMDENRSLAGRVANALAFIAVIFCLALWITAFLIFRESLPPSGVSSILFTDLSCLTFFGGLALSIGIGAFLGNISRRFLWKKHTHSRAKYQEKRLP